MVCMRHNTSIRKEICLLSKTQFVLMPPWFASCVLYMTPRFLLPVLGQRSAQPHVYPAAPVSRKFSTWPLTWYMKSFMGLEFLSKVNSVMDEPSRGQASLGSHVDRATRGCCFSTHCTPPRSDTLDMAYPEYASAASAAHVSLPHTVTPTARGREHTAQGTYRRTD